jgi:hypothetical protein
MFEARLAKRTGADMTKAISAPAHSPAKQSQREDQNVQDDFLNVQAYAHFDLHDLFRLHRKNSVRSGAPDFDIWEVFVSRPNWRYLTAVAFGGSNGICPHGPRHRRGDPYDDSTPSGGRAGAQLTWVDSASRIDPERLKPDQGWKRDDQSPDCEPRRSHHAHSDARDVNLLTSRHLGKETR